MCEALTYLLDNIFIRFGTKLYRQIVGIPMGTNCVPLIADLFLFCYERDYMAPLSCNKKVEIVQAFNSISRYLDDLLNMYDILQSAPSYASPLARKRKSSSLHISSTTRSWRRLMPADTWEWSQTIVHDQITSLR